MTSVHIKVGMWDQGRRRWSQDDNVMIEAGTGWMQLKHTERTSRISAPNWRWRKGSDDSTQPGSLHCSFWISGPEKDEVIIFCYFKPSFLFPFVWYFVIATQKTASRKMTMPSLEKTTGPWTGGLMQTLPYPRGRKDNSLYLAFKWWNWQCFSWMRTEKMEEG